MYLYSTVDEAIIGLNEQFAECGFESIVEPNKVATNIKEAAELDYDALNQLWADWIDLLITTKQAPSSASNWDWEN